MNSPAAATAANPAATAPAPVAKPPMSEPRKYRKKPVVIEAMRYDGRNIVEVAEWLRGHGVKIGWSGDTIAIPTLEGRIYASPDDYIIRGIQGEFYPCKPHIFRETYEETADE